MLSTIVGPTGAIAPITESNQKILLYAAATDTFARQNTHVFKDSVDAKYDCEVLVAEALKRDMERVALLGAIGEFTEDCKKSIEEGIAQQGRGELVLYEIYERGETDFRTRLTKIQARSPDVLFISAYADDCILIWKHIKELNVQIPFMIPFAQTGCGEERAMREINGFPATIIGLDFIVDKNSPEYQNFIQGFRAKYGKKPSLPFFTTLAYDWAHYIAKAFEQCNPENSACVRSALEKTDHNGALGKVSFQPTHATFRPRTFIEFENGKWV
jgi:ABC-type branched-subunit amino acid transport system substrate-binding protein